jgi:hypothetical protein
MLLVPLIFVSVHSSDPYCCAELWLLYKNFIIKAACLLFGLSTSSYQWYRHPFFDCCHLDPLITLLVPAVVHVLVLFLWSAMSDFFIAVAGSVAISGSTNLFIFGTFLRWFSIQMLVFEIIRLALFDS